MQEGGGPTPAAHDGDDFAFDPGSLAPRGMYSGTFNLSVFALGAEGGLGMPGRTLCDVETPVGVLSVQGNEEGLLSAVDGGGPQWLARVPCEHGRTQGANGLARIRQ